jgi:hypothetical protein
MKARRNWWAWSCLWTSVLVAGAFAERQWPGIAFTWLGVPMMSGLIAFGFWLGSIPEDDL